MAAAKRKGSSREPVEKSPAPAGAAGALDRFFGLAASGSSVATELRAGLATFLTMAYIMFVNPAILQQAGMDHGAVFVHLPRRGGRLPHHGALRQLPDRACPGHGA